MRHARGMLTGDPASRVQAHRGHVPDDNPSRSLVLVSVLVDPGALARLKGSNAEAAAVLVPKEGLGLAWLAMHPIDSGLGEGAGHRRATLGGGKLDHFCAWKHCGSRRDC